MNELIARLNAEMATTVPRAFQMGVRITEMAPGRVRLDVPLDGNTNHFGAVYAGVVFTVAEMVGGALHFATFDVTTHYPLVRGMSIQFRAPGRGPLHAVAELPRAELDRILAASVVDGRPAKVNFEVQAQVLAEDGTLVATTTGDYQIRPVGT